MPTKFLNDFNSYQMVTESGFQSQKTCTVRLAIMRGIYVERVKIDVDRIGQMGVGQCWR